MWDERVKTIIIMLSTYNGSQYLNEQLNSVYQQNTQCHIRLLFRDDGSTDNTKEILGNWKSKLDILDLSDDKSMGVSKSFWHLLKAAPNADFYAFMDQDDIWDSTKISTAIESLGQVQGPAMWCSNCRIIDKNGIMIHEKMYRERPILTIPSQLVCGCIQGCAMIFNAEARRYVLKKSPASVPMHDIVMITYMLAAGKVIYENTPLFSYRMHDNNVIAKGGKNRIQKMKSTLSLWFAKEKRNQVSVLARQILLDNLEYLDVEIKGYLNNLGNCPENIQKRFIVAFHTLSTANNRRVLR